MQTAALEGLFLHQALALGALAKQLFGAQARLRGAHRHGDKSLLIGGVDNDRIRAIEQRPTVREVQGDAQLGMVEVLAAAHPGGRRITEGQTFQVLQKHLAIDLLLTAGQGAGRADHLLQAPIIVRVAVEHAVVTALGHGLAALGGLVAGEHFLILQHLDHFDHRLRVVAAARQVLGAKAVGLQLHVPAITADHRRAEHIGDIRRGADTGADGHRLAENAPGRRLALLLHAVPRRDMADFVTKHRSQLGFRTEVGQQAAVDIDVAAGQGEGVDVRRIDHGEVVAQVAAMAVLGHPLAHLLHIGLQLLVGVARVLLENLLVVAVPQGQLLLLAHHHEIGAPGGRIVRTPRQQSAAQQQHSNSHTHGNSSNMAG